MTNTQQRNWIFWLVLLTLIIGLGTGLIALIAPMGYRYNLWEYRIGFEILRNVVPYSVYIAVSCLAIASLVGILGITRQRPDITRLASFALFGALVAALTWYVPRLYVAPENQPYPSIHDISTDTENPPEFVAVLPLRADADNGTDYGMSRDMNPELLIQLTRQHYPDLQPVTLSVPPDTAFDLAMAAVKSLGWELVEADKMEGRIEATDTTFWFRFKDDIVIRIRPAGTDSRIDARSVSRVGKGDIGVNARRLRNFYSLLNGSITAEANP